GLRRRERRRAVMECVRGYRWNIGRLQSMPVMDVWHLHSVADHLDSQIVKVDAVCAVIIQKAVAKARAQTNASLLTKVAQRSSSGAWRFKEDPPILTPLDAKTHEKVIDALHAYGESLSH